MSPELELLIGLTSPLSVEENRLREIAGQCDEKEFFQLASFHKLLSLLKKNYPEFLPTVFSRQFNAELSRFERQVSFTNLTMAGELISLCREAEEQGIAIVPFKGIGLSQKLYGDINYRSCCDLDLLVARDKVKQTCSLLKERGFEISPQVNERQHEAYLKTEHFFSCFHPQKGVKIDLHWDFTNKYAIRPLCFEDVENHLTQLKISGSSLAFLSNEACLVQLCVHAASHCWEHLEFITSVSYLLANNYVDLDEALRLARKIRSVKMVLLGIRLAHIIYKIPLPKDFTENFGSIEALANDIGNSFLHPNKRSSVLTWRYSSLHLQLRDSTVDRMIYILRLLFRPTIKEWQIFPALAPLWRLYYLIRPGRLLFETIKNMMWRKE
jgi:hypothetical protein